jgi:hypothetical protein
LITRIAVVICALLAWLLARATPTRRQRVIAWTLAILAAIDCVRPLARRWPPLDMALLLAWYAATAWGVWSVLKSETLGAEAPRVSPVTSPASPERLGMLSLLSRVTATPHEAAGGPTGVLARSSRWTAWILLSFALFASSVLALRYRVTPQLAGLVFGVALAVELYAAARFALRREVPGQAETVALLLAASSLADVAGPWLFGDPVRDWYAGRWPALVTWCAVGAWEIRCLIRARRLRA